MKTQNTGFTLVEIMIVVAIVGILASIALPAYNEHVRTSRRAAIQSCLMEQSQFMERYKTTNMTYAGATLPNPVCQGNAAAFYNVDFNGAGTVNTFVNTFTLQAAPLGDQLSAKSACNKATLTIDQSGARSPNGCW